jgi:ADP-ribose pyrophosphatase YjhB (NUDIX family)
MPHIHDKIDFTVEVFVVYKNTVLLRKHDKYKVWLSVGGHIELYEDPNQAAIREVKEEVGLDVILDDALRTFQKNEADYSELIPPYFVNRHRINDKHEHVTFTYFAKTNSNKIEQLTEDEQSSDCSWFTKEELERLEDIRESVKHYALKALNVLEE